MENQIRCYSDVVSEKYVSENVNTNTSADQVEAEAMVLNIYKQFEKNAAMDLPLLNRNAHSTMLKAWLKCLPNSYEYLDASKPWLVYWILHSLWLLNDMPDAKTLSHVVSFLVHCQHEEGGYGGGPSQNPHLVTTYAAVNALSIIGTHEAYDSIDRSSLQKFLWAVKGVDGSFALYKGGEQDIRGAYCAISIAKLTYTYTEALFDKTAEWIVSCQTYEGGFAGCPGMEAHGGYSFCGLASLALLNRTTFFDIDALLRWCVNRQMRVEGGFQGRTNKLVDSCYSFWQGAVFPIISAILSQDKQEMIGTVFFNQGALQEYVVVCCQAREGGLINKPGALPDIYHTCYTLSGLSVAQHTTKFGDVLIVGHPTNELNRVNVLHNVPAHLVSNAVQHFKRHPHKPSVQVFVHPPPVKDRIFFIFIFLLYIFVCGLMGP